jgi:hypothetical protein
MSTYSITLPVVVNAGTPAYVIGIKPNTYEMRFTQLVAANIGTNYIEIDFYRQTGSTLSGGSAVTPTPLRDGAQPCSATARYGASLTVSGTALPLFLVYENSASGSVSYYGGLESESAGAVTGSSPLPITVAPGGVFYVTFSSAYTLYTYVTIFFEELRLQGSY